MIRTTEDHPIFGLTTKDLQLYDYIEADGLWFPQQQKIIYGDRAFLEETIITSITVNPQFKDDYFNGLSSDETDTTPAPPQAVPGYGKAVVGEYWSTFIWSGPYTGTLANASSTTLAADLPGAHHLVFLDSPSFGQMILEFEESVIVFEAPPHQTDLVIQWVKKHLDKPISHLYVSRPPNIGEQTSKLTLIFERFPITIMIIALQSASLWRLEHPLLFQRSPHHSGDKFLILI